jgi:hypothetical protein
MIDSTPTFYQQLFVHDYPIRRAGRHNRMDRYGLCGRETSGRYETVCHGEKLCHWETCHWETEADRHEKLWRLSAPAATSYFAAA